MPTRIGLPIILVRYDGTPLGSIVKEIKILGPVFLHQMYPFERYIAVLKRYVRNHANPEGCMIQGYHTEEVVGSCTDYINGTQQLGVPPSVHEDRLCGRGRVGRKTWNNEGHNLLAEVHASILQQLQIVTSYATKHIEELHMDNEDDESIETEMLKMLAR